VRVLEEHLDSARPDRWRSALRILEHSWGRPPEHVLPAELDRDDEFNVESMPTSQLIAFVREHRKAREPNAENHGSGVASDAGGR
jgi:hypothetical protein